MAPINVYGTAVVRVSLPGNRGVWEELGITRNGVDVTEVTKTLDLPTDYFGGTEGAPSDIAFLSRIDRLRIELTKYNIGVANSVRPPLMDNIPLNMFPAGALYLSGGWSLGIWLDYARAELPAPGLISDRVYQDAIVRDNIEINKGSKFSRLVLVADCYVRAASSLPSDYVAGGPAEYTGGTVAPQPTEPTVYDEAGWELFEQAG